MALTKGWYGIPWTGGATKRRSDGATQGKSASRRHRVKTLVFSAFLACVTVWHAGCALGDAAQRGRAAYCADQGAALPAWAQAALCGE